jgi:hypothetical protein
VDGASIMSRKNHRTVCQTFFVQKGLFSWWLGEKMDEDRQTEHEATTEGAR